MKRYEVWPKWMRNRIEMAYYEYRIPHWLVAVLFGRDAANGLQILRKRQERVEGWFDESDDYDDFTLY